MILAGARRAHLEPVSRPVLQEIAASLWGATHLAALAAAADLDVVLQGRPMERLAHHKDLLREAARLALDDILADGAPTQAARGAPDNCAVMRRELRLKACARAMWRGDARLVRKLLAAWPGAQEYFR